MYKGIAPTPARGRKIITGVLKLLRAPSKFTGCTGLGGVKFVEARSVTSPYDYFAAGLTQYVSFDNSTRQAVTISQF